MKNLFLCLVLLCSSLSISAQGYTETVHLKNGSIIHGIIFEQIPNESLKIRTNDGNIFVFQMDEVAKITKDLSKLSTRISKEDSGYRGFVDLGYSFGVGDYGVDRIELSTSHGYQFNSYLYLGIGAALNYYHDGDVASVPIFVNPRLNIPTHEFAYPYIDIKIGYTVSEYVEGFYLAPSVGIGFDLQNNKAINLSIGYTMQRASMYYYDYNTGYRIFNNNMGAITLKMGFQF